MSNQLHEPEFRAMVAQQYLDGADSSGTLASKYDSSNF